jgi:DNA polymerase bacteriophage-type
MLERIETSSPRPLLTVSALHIDFETRSTVNLKKAGVHTYAQHPTTGIWCACFACDDGPVQTWQPGQPCPRIIVDQVRNGGPIWAHNVMFERLIWQHILTPRHGWPAPAFEQWECTMARAFAQALPGSLENAAAAVGLSETKDAAGYALMMRMAKPRRYNEDGTPVWWDDPDRLLRLIAYCRQDVVVERELCKRLYHLTALEHDIWQLDQVINDRGIGVDVELCEVARKLVERALRKLNAEIIKVSNGRISTVNSVKQIIDWCQARGLDKIDSIRADKLEELLIRDDLPADVCRVLEIRQEASKASVKKIDALLNGRSPDNRARGLLAYHAASTGRWAGRRFQPQNIKRPEDHDQDGLIKLVRTGSSSLVEMLGGPVLQVVGDILRGMIIPAPGKWLYAADFANIEGRALAWLAGEQWKVEAFESYDRGEGPDIYKLAFNRAFGTPFDEITSERRQVGKVMELALGYQGGVGAFQSMASVYRVKVSDEQADIFKRAWRFAHPKTCALWTAVENAAIAAMTSNSRTAVLDSGKVAFHRAGSFLSIRLPSGRRLFYPYPKLMQLPTPFGWRKTMLTYKSAVNPSNAHRLVEDKENKDAVITGWGRISAYGGLLVENLCQAIARDIMAEAMLRVERAGFPVILTVHDEVVAETGMRDVKEFEQLMEIRPSWAKDFPIVAKAWRGDRYRKD